MAGKENQFEENHENRTEGDFETDQSETETGKVEDIDKKEQDNNGPLKPAAVEKMDNNGPLKPAAVIGNMDNKEPWNLLGVKPKIVVREREIEDFKQKRTNAKRAHTGTRRKLTEAVKLSASRSEVDSLLNQLEKNIEDCRRAHCQYLDDHKEFDSVQLSREGTWLMELNEDHDFVTQIACEYMTRCGPSKSTIHSSVSKTSKRSSRKSAYSAKAYETLKENERSRQEIQLKMEQIKAEEEKRKEEDEFIRKMEERRKEDEEILRKRKEEEEEILRRRKKDEEDYIKLVEKNRKQRELENELEKIRFADSI
jgi:hypothetical protein